jgi:hypothetical protein
MHTPKTPWLGVREQTIPTERPPLVSEVVRTFADRGVSHGQRDDIPTVVISVFETWSRHFFVAPQFTASMTTVRFLRGAESLLLYLVSDLRETLDLCLLSSPTA